MNKTIPELTPIGNFTLPAPILIAVHRVGQNSAESMNLSDLRDAINATITSGGGGNGGLDSVSDETNTNLTGIIMGDGTHLGAIDPAELTIGDFAGHKSLRLEAPLAGLFFVTAGVVFNCGGGEGQFAIGDTDGPIFQKEFSTKFFNFIVGGLIFKSDTQLVPAENGTISAPFDGCLGWDPVGETLVFFNGTNWVSAAGSGGGDFETRISDLETACSEGLHTYPLFISNGEPPDGYSSYECDFDEFGDLYVYIGEPGVVDGPSPDNEDWLKLSNNHLSSKNITFELLESGEDPNDYNGQNMTSVTHDISVRLARVEAMLLLGINMTMHLADSDLVSGHDITVGNGLITRFE